MKRGAPPRSLPSCPLRSPFGPSSNLSFYSDYRSTTYPFTLTIAQQQIRSHPLTLSPSHPSTLSPAYPVPDRNPIAWLLGMFKEPHHTVPPHSSLEAWVQKEPFLSWCFPDGWKANRAANERRPDGQTICDNATHGILALRALKIRQMREMLGYHRRVYFIRYEDLQADPVRCDVYFCIFLLFIPFILRSRH